MYTYFKDALMFLSKIKNIALCLYISHKILLNGCLQSRIFKIGVGSKDGWHKTVVNVTFWHFVETSKYRCFETLQGVCFNRTMSQGSGQRKLFLKDAESSAFDWQSKEQTTQLHIYLQKRKSKYLCTCMSTRAFCEGIVKRLYLGKKI